MVHKPLPRPDFWGGGTLAVLTGHNDHLLVVSEAKARPVERRLEAELGFGTTATTCTSGTWSGEKTTVEKWKRGIDPNIEPYV